MMGLQDARDRKTGKELRIDNAVEVRKWMQGLSKRLQNKLYLEWVERVSSHIDKSNIDSSLYDYAENNFRFGNKDYWNRIKSKVQNSPFNRDKMQENREGKATFKIAPTTLDGIERGSSTIIAPPFCGGGLAHADEFMLPKIKNLRLNRQLGPQASPSMMESQFNLQLE